MSEQVAPYPEPDGTATGGHSGSETSRERAVEDVASGALGARQRQVYAFLDTLREQGLTVVDLRDLTGWHHGQASAVLSNLHKAGKITRLKQRRDRCELYVFPEFAAGREESPFRPNKRKVQRLNAGDTFETVIGENTKTIMMWRILFDGTVRYAGHRVEEQEDE